MPARPRKVTPNMFVELHLEKFVPPIRYDIVHIHYTGGPYYDGIFSLIDSLPYSPVVIETMHHFQLLAPDKVDVIVAISLFSKKKLIPTEYWNKVVLIYNGIDTNIQIVDKTAKKKELQLPLDKIILGRVSRLEFDKFSPDVIQGCYKKVLDAIPNSHLVIVGDGTGRSRLMMEARLSGIHDRCSFLGARLDVSELLQIFDVFVYPISVEFFGLVVVEAMAHGVPVVASRVGSLPELITDGKSGYLADTYEEFPELVRLALQNRDKIAENAREVVLTRFSTERMVKDYMNLYREVIMQRD